MAILKFRHLLEEHGLGEGLFAEISGHLESQGHRVRKGTIVEAPSSTKNKAGERDPEMRQTKKGNQWHFGMKAHIGVDAETGLAHSLAASVRPPPSRPSSHCSRMRACVCFRAGARPLFVSDFRSPRSSSVSLTRWIFLGTVDTPCPPAVAAKDMAFGFMPQAAVTNGSFQM